jgi:hypothetical protein
MGDTLRHAANAAGFRSPETRCCLRGSLYKWIVVLAATAATAPALALAALADKEQIHLTASGQGAARAAVLRKGDLGTSGAWTGGSVKPDLSSALPCSTFQPKQSDLVLNGAARTHWTQPGLSFDSEAQVLQTAHMVTLDWQRTVLAPQLLPCLRSGLAKSAGASAHVVSVRRIAFAHVATYTNAIRVLIDVTTTTAKVRVFVDVVVFGRGRTELTLTATAPLLLDASIRPAETRLAKILVARIRA